MVTTTNMQQNYNLEGKWEPNPTFYDSRYEMKLTDALHQKFQSRAYPEIRTKYEEGSKGLIPKGHSNIALVQADNGSDYIYSYDGKFIRAQKRKMPSNKPLAVDGINNFTQKQMQHFANFANESLCWEGYEKQGMKKKGGKLVNNCVKKKQPKPDEEIKE